MNKRIAVAMSGGIDSSVTALLLKQQGYDVVGISAQTTFSEESQNVIHRAKEVAQKLEIPFYAYDATNIFQKKVIKYFENSYASGETPNPCIMCNKYMKWGGLFDFAIKELKADFIATGHYAEIKKIDNYYKLYPATDEHKDQLYFLFMLEQKHLAKTLFPLSKLQKEEVRRIAIEKDLPSKSSKESQDICFINPPMTTKKYLNNILPKKQGYFIEKSTGKILGEHTGFWQYTVGQRKGIGIAAPEALYVIDTDACKNVVYVGFKNELYSDELKLKSINWSYPVDKNKFEALVKIRYNMPAEEASIEIREKEILIKFKKGISSIAKGQACVIYDINDGHLLGGNFI